MQRNIMAVVLVGVSLAVAGCTQQKIPPAPAPQPTPSNTPMVAASPTPQTTAWDIAIDLARCQRDELRVIPGPFGSNSIRVKGIIEDNNCLLEYTIEVEGGYTVYGCRLPTVRGEILPAQIDVKKMCQTVRTGNVFLDTPTPQ